MATRSDGRIERAQYVVREFLRSDKRVVGVRTGDDPLTAIIVLEDGTEQPARGKLAVDILSGNEPAKDPQE